LRWVGSVSPMAASRPQQFKVVLLGEGRVGKTSLVLRFCKGTFTDGQPPTIQASCLDKVLRIGDKSLHLVIWDTAGQERFHALGPIYYRDADAALLVYDITDSDSFNKVKTWVKELRKMVGDEIVLTIAGNKADLERQRVVSKQDGMDYAASCGATYFETSAKLGRGIDEVFSGMGKRLLQTSRGGGDAASASARAQSSTSMLVDEPLPSSRSSSGCC